MKKMYRYRIYTEHINSCGVYIIISKYFDGFTVYKGIGIWQNEVEDSLIIEIIVPKNRRVDIEATCCEINQLNHQECVLVTVDRVKTIFIHG